MKIITKHTIGRNGRKAIRNILKYVGLNLSSPFGVNQKKMYIP